MLMTTHIRTLLFFINCLCISQHALLSQNFKEDLIKISKNMNSLKSYSLTLDYKLYIDNKVDRPYQERNVVVKKKNSDFLCIQNNSLEVFASTSSQIIVDHLQKTIILLPKAQFKHKEVNPTEVFESYIDTIISAYDKVSFKDVGTNVGCYEFTFKNGKYSKMKLLFDKNLYVPLTVFYFPISEIQINQKENEFHKVMLEVNYIGFKPNCDINQKEMNSGNYIYTENKKTFVHAKFKSYEFINLQDNVYDKEY